jgi:sulfur transfer complex TusBCD TusB component (DsrH family)
MKGIFVIKNEDKIIIANNGVKLIITGEEFEKLKSFSKEEIIKWYKTRK